MKKIVSALALSLVGACPAWGAFSTTVTTNTYANIALQRSGNTLYTLTDQPPLGSSTSVGSQSASVLGPTELGGSLSARVDVKASAQAGVLRAYSTANAVARHTGRVWPTDFAYYDLAATVSGSAGAGMVDTVVWSIGSLPVGTPLTLRFDISVDGDLSYQTLIASSNTRSFGSAYANWFVQIAGSGVTTGNFSSLSAPAAFAGRTFGGVDSRDVSGLGSFTFEQRVLNAVPVELRMSLGTGTSINLRDMCHANPACQGSAGGIEATATGDMMHTFAWGGVQQVRLNDGSLLDLNSLDAVSSSGLDYRLSALPVPEPASWAMLVLGLVALKTARRNSHRRGA